MSQDSLDENDDLLSLILFHPQLPAPVEAIWTLMAYNKRIRKSWLALCQHTPSQAAQCYRWLSQQAMQPIPGRCYALKHKAYAGCWCYEVGAGNRVYYKPDEAHKRVVVYYAGPHPPQAPVPPTGL